MILTRVINHLKLNRRITLRDTALELSVSPDALREILGVLERKGKVQKLASGTKCSGSCSKCAPETIEIYEWTLN